MTTQDAKEAAERILKRYEPVKGLRYLSTVEPDELVVARALLSARQGEDGSTSTDQGTDLVERLREQARHHLESIPDWKNRGEMGKRFEAIMMRKAALLTEAANELDRLRRAPVGAAPSERVMSAAKRFIEREAQASARGTMTPEWEAASVSAALLKLVWTISPPPAPSGEGESS